ncbi:MAG: hypothetical protein QOC99_3798 [Acidobacteriota bacterium]|nr:hypothetical protein [Acidobacteriota bacterium]MDT7781286.1 hypothetical protein [Acidobacteriota bacterium]
MKNSNSLARRLAVLFALFALTLGSILPVSAATAQRRRARTRRSRVVRRVVTTPAPPPVRYFTVAADQVIRVRLETELSSQSARVGDRFSTTVTEPVYGESGIEVVPVGSKVWGRVTSVLRAQRRKPGSISVSFYQIEMPNRVRQTINGSLSSLQADNVNSDNEGTVAGRKNDKRNAIFIGGGAVAGGLIGAIAGGGKGAAIGAILGGALGTGARVYEKEQEADVKSGTEFGVILNRSVSLPEYKAQ